MPCCKCPTVGTRLPLTDQATETRPSLRSCGLHIHSPRLCPRVLGRPETLTAGLASHPRRTVHSLQRMIGTGWHTLLALRESSRAKQKAVFSVLGTGASFVVIIHYFRWRVAWKRQFFTLFGHLQIVRRMQYPNVPYLELPVNCA